MGRKTVVLLPKIEKKLEEMGERIKLARLRRNLTMELVCERASISRQTLSLVEKGSPRVAMGIYASVLHALNGLDDEIDNIAKDDTLGRTIQDLNLITKKRARKI